MPADPTLSLLERTDPELARYFKRREEQARAAYRAARQALEAGDRAAARRWIERASRLAPHDERLKVSLALIDPQPADEALLVAVAKQYRLRLAWLALAALRSAAGRPEAAAAALAAALADEAGPVDAGLAALASTLAAVTGRPGWCAVIPGGLLEVSPNLDPRSLTLTLDGRPFRPRWEEGRRCRLPGCGGRPGKGGLLEISREGKALLGSPVDLGRLRRFEGVVWPEPDAAGGWQIRGSAWYPADPERCAEIWLIDARRRRFGPFRAADETITPPPASPPFARPRGFVIPREVLAEASPPFRLQEEGGAPLLGSPIDPRLLQPEAPKRRPPRFDPDPRRGVVVVMPVFDDAEKTLAALDALEAHTPKEVPLLVIDDASPDAALCAALAERAAQGRIVLERFARNRGYPEAVNAGLRWARGRDVVLLNSDTLVPPGWLERLRAAAYAAPDIGTATPLSNQATILSYPSPAGNPMPPRAALLRLDRLIARTLAGRRAEIPVGVGFCLYLRADCLADVGPFRARLFGPGYGEENDFCLRARRRGWRHVAALDLFVGHHGGASFGTLRPILMARNAALLEWLHPGYEAEIAAFLAADPLFAVRREIDMARWREARRKRGSRPAVLLVSHDRGGGVARAVAGRRAQHAMRRIGVLELRGAPLGRPRRSFLVDPTAPEAYPNLGFTLPEEAGALAALLAAEKVGLAELHHFLGHDVAGVMALLRRLDLPYDVFVHDYGWICPRIALSGPSRRYCGEPPVEACAPCVAARGRAIEDPLDAAALRARSASILGQARRVVVPSGDTAARLLRHFPDLRLVHEPWEEVRPAPRPLAHAPPAAGRPVTVLLAGGIGEEKGIDVLRELALDAAARALPLRFVVVGYTEDDAALLSTGRVFITGDYDEGEGVALIQRENADLGFIASVVPETWSYVLSDMWRAGLPVVAFDLGAQAERIRAADGGAVLPLGLPPPAINDYFLALAAGMREAAPLRRSALALQGS